MLNVARPAGSSQATLGPLTARGERIGMRIERDEGQEQAALEAERKLARNKRYAARKARKG